MKHLYTLLLCTLATIGLQAQTVFINEIHYDNDGVDQGEAVEIAGPAGTDLSGWALLLYDGANGMPYDTILLANIIPNQDDGYGTLSFPTIGIQNGAPDGIVLIDNVGSVIQFLSYEGAFTATSGPASGLTSTNISVFETGNTPVGHSMQLIGNGAEYDDFFWSSGTQPNTYNAVNTGQNFAPVNDICSNAYTINCGIPVSGSTVNGVLSPFSTCGTSINTQGVWYTYSSTSAGAITASTCNNANFDTKISIFRGDCANLICVGGNDDGAGCANATSEVTVSTLANEDYFIFVHGFNGATGNFTLTLTCGPEAVCQGPITVPLDANGQATITPNDIDGGSASPNGIQNLSLDITSFDCSDIGSNFVTLTVTDSIGETDDCVSEVIIVDDMDPIAVVVSSFDAFLDANGQVTIVPADIDNGSTDNCGIASSSLDISSFACSDIGANNVVLTVMDGSGNSASETTVVNVIDNLPPVLMLQDVTIDLDSNGEAFLGTGQVDIGTTDNCGSLTTVLSDDFFTCADIGPNEVVFTATDTNGNSSVATVLVTVEDIDDPLAITNNIQVSLDASGSITISPSDVDAGSSDNCSIANLSLDMDTFDCSDIGINTVVLTVTDPSGNSASETATVDVVDDSAPTVIGQDITVDLAGNASVSIVPADIDNGSTDNCDITLSIDVDTFTTQGVFPVVLTGTDSSENSSTDTVDVTVFDSTLSVSDVDAPNSIVLFPNPTSAELQIRTEILISEIRVYSVGGERLKGIQFVENTLDVSSLASGIYFVQVVTPEGIFVRRFVRQ